MRLPIKFCILFFLNMLLLKIAFAQSNFKLHGNIYSGFCKTTSETYFYEGRSPDEFCQSKSYTSPASYFGIGLTIKHQKIKLGFDYLIQKYNWRNETRISNIITGKIENYTNLKVDDYYIKRVNLGYSFFNNSKWETELSVGYAFPAINFWGFRRGYSATYGQQGNQIDKYWIYKCRASGYSVSLNTGIISKNQKSKLSLTLGSEWLSNNTPNRFESDWMSMEKNTWYYSVGLRYSRLMKEWGKGK